MALLEVDDVGISFGGLRAVDGVSFAVQPSEIFAVIGPNGAGKTTLFNLVSRIHQPTSGRIVFDDRDITRIAPHDVARAGIARTFQNINLFDTATVVENLMLGRYRHDRSRLWQQALFTPFVRRERLADRRSVEKVIEFLQLGKYRSDTVADLPYGIRKVVELGRALAAQPRLLLLDEPSSGLNPEETRDMAFWIQDVRDDLDVTVILIEHDMSLVSAVADRLMVMSSGRIVAIGKPADVRRDPRVAAEYMGG